MKSQMVINTITVLFAIVGWFVINDLAAKRDHENKRREIRLDYLIKTFQYLADAANRNLETQDKRNIEKATSDIQLLGSKSQIQILNDYCKNLKEKKEASLGPLLDDLRNELRKELKLGLIKEEIDWIRFVD
jgi:hypothetical protein